MEEEVEMKERKIGRERKRLRKKTRCYIKKINNLQRRKRFTEEEEVMENEMT